MRITQLSTPAALVDQAKMAHNLLRMQSRMNALQVRFRPHVKTTKCLPIVQAQIAAGAQGITVSTLKEAEQFFAAGVQDILYAVGIAPSKLAQAAALQHLGCNLKLIVDSLAGATALTAYGQAHQVQFSVLLEIDTDGHRSGIKPEAQALIDIGRHLHQTGSHLQGVMTHAGASYELNSSQALAAMAEQERALCVRAAERLRAAGLPCPIVSIGSTPTALSAANLVGVTEVRAGVYIFFDLVMANVGVCGLEDIALSVLTTVIGHQEEKGWILVDAGWMAMSRDRGTQKQDIDYGYGQVCDADGVLIEGLTMTSANQEHGILSQSVTHSGRQDSENLTQRFPVGTLLRILPNHACATGAQFPDYQALGEQGLMKTWPRFYGW